MPRYRVLPYRQGSRSATALAEALGGLCLRLRGSTFRPRRDDIIINWGNTNEYEERFRNADGFFNLPSNTRNASNKLNFFRMMERTGNEDIVPPFYTRQQDIPDEAFPIVCRTILAGHSARGIVVANCRDDLVPAPLYVRYIPKEQEYRVHVGRERVIFIQRKARRLDTPDDEINWQIRNLEGGFNFVAVTAEEVPPSVLEVAHRSLQASGLDFGGCDVIYNRLRNQAYVLEINTACGLEPRTAQAYADYFREIAQ